MKTILHTALICSFLFAIHNFSFAQKSYGDLYHPEADAVQDIEKLITQAAMENKHIILQVGGNWCIWCYRLHDFIKADSTLQRIVDQDFLVYHLNYSKENKNPELLEKYNHPERFGFPVLLILNDNGELIHTQNSALLESAKSYDPVKVKEFLLGWTQAALDPASYKN